ncbi:LOW QUALITY PROTEIN: breast cancer anti-estrogen resistance protein 3 homolog [Thrips palmi]|uniref:LOW QUALITY PROTEIN: breast cancer anti-estrogen resistance protein 3 homolog n=1 Tax=Thrips palmi TaxID=161013 RepID=A0A6P8ZH95_THRPL|nr:LOW QUALITY PROTEIN: breast cancer anti-estrogen resistance protein 3 homolog [Thrips palmi]
MGKSGSKLKPKNRSQSIVWSFRFPSIGSLSRKSKASLSQPVARPHIDTQRWLSVLDLDQYGDLFRKFDGVEDLLHFNESDIKELGVRNSSHRARLMSSLVALKAKYEKGTRRVDKAQRHSVAVDPRRLVDLNAHADILVASNVTQSKSLCNITMDEPAGDPTALRRLLEWELSLDSQDLRSHAWYHGAIPRHRAEEIVDRHGDFLVRDCASQPGNFVLTCRSNGASLHFVINKVVLQPDTVYERVQYQFEADAYDTVPDLVTYYVGSGKPISAASGARIQTPRNRLYPLSFYAEKYALQSIAGVTAGMSPMTSPLSALPPLTPGSRMSPYSCFRSPCTRRRGRRSLSLTPGEVLNGHAKLTLSLADRARPEDHGGSADVVHANGAANGTANGTTPSRFSTHSLPRSNGKLSTCKGTSTMPRHGHGAVHAAHNKMLRVNSDLEGVACSPRDAANAPNAVPATPLSDSPPPKPSRVPPATCSTPAPPGAAAEEDVDGDVADLGDLGDTTPVSESGSSLASAAALQRAAIASYHASGSDSGNGSGSSAQSSAAGDVPDSAAAAAAGGSGSGTLKRGVIIYLPSSCSSTTLKACDEGVSGPGVAAADLPDLPSALDPDSFQTLLLPSLENKPLDATALQGIKMMLLESGSRILANHLTRDDLDLTLATAAPNGQPWDQGLGLGIKSGIELCCLPVGRQLRTDLVERTECLKLLVAVTILTCPTETERAELLNKWIQVAVDTKTALGNLFGFCGIMLGLCMPQLQRLAATWHVLRQRFTDSAFNFEAKLRPTLKSMNECANPQAPNTTIPHLLPFLLLNARPAEAMVSGASSCGVPQSTLNACIAPWESSTSDFGLGTMWAHLEAARRFGDSMPTFRRNSEIVLSDSKVDDLLLDAFRTEFHLKFLWGSRGASVDAEERHAKFDQVLTVMSEKCEPPLPPASQVMPHAHGVAGGVPSTLGHHAQGIGTSV